MIYFIILIVLGPVGSNGRPGRTHIVHCRDNTDKVDLLFQKVIIYIG